METIVEKPSVDDLPNVSTIDLNSDGRTDANPQSSTAVNSGISKILTRSDSQCSHTPVKKPVQFYRKPLPSSCIGFGSHAGIRLFKSAMNYEYMEIYFSLGPQLRTQDEPAYCGLSSLVMVLNSLAVDPGMVWKGVWRWYHEEMLDCCAKLSDVRKTGITIPQLVCAAKCNQLDGKPVYVTDDASIEDFRECVKKTCRGDGTSIICSFSRAILGQTGTGHFSPIGGYHPVEDCVLILETARFKYPPYWLPITTLWNSMSGLDVGTGKPRGYIVLTKVDRQPSLLLRLSPDYSIFSSVREKSGDFFTSVIEFLGTEYDTQKNLDDEMMVVVNEILQFSTHCDPSMDYLLKFRVNGENFTKISEEHQEAVIELVLTIEKTKAFCMFSKNFSKENQHPASESQRLYDPKEALHLRRGWRNLNQLRCPSCLDLSREDTSSYIEHTVPYILAIFLHILPALESSVLADGKITQLSKTYLGAINYYIGKDMAIAAQAAGTYESLCTKSTISLATTSCQDTVFMSNSLLSLNTVPIKISDVPLMKMTPGMRDLIGQQLFYNEVSQLQEQLGQVFNL